MDDTVWDRVSHRYDRQHWLERSAIATAVELLDPAPEERLLDVATGTGAPERKKRLPTTCPAGIAPPALIKGLAPVRAVDPPLEVR